MIQVNEYKRRQAAHRAESHDPRLWHRPPHADRDEAEI